MNTRVILKDHLFSLQNVPGAQSILQDQPKKEFPFVLSSDMKISATSEKHDVSLYDPSKLCKLYWGEQSRSPNISPLGCRLQVHGVKNKLNILELVKASMETSRWNREWTGTVFLVTSTEMKGSRAKECNSGYSWERTIPCQRSDQKKQRLPIFNRCHS